MGDYRVKFLRADTGAIVERRVQAGSSNAARSAVESRGHAVLTVSDERGGVALADDSDHAPPHMPPPPIAGADVVSILRSIDDRLGRIERGKIVRAPGTTIMWSTFWGALIAVGALTWLMRMGLW